ncbi:MAG: F0F1 ATP synthase subunit A, partial [Oligoflexia bacterium]|nr:F0F1 ATP synthase subunit A [Oligoflexia bacterium]
MGHFNWFNLVPFLDKYSSHKTVHMLMASLITVICIIISVVMYKKFRKIKDPEIPDDKFTGRTIFELLGEVLLALASDVMGEKSARKFFPVLASVFLFIFLNNAISLIPGFVPATDNLNTTLACGIFIFLYYNYVGVKEHGIAYFKHFLGPILWLSPLMLPIELISHSVRPLSLGLRLFGNITGDHLVLGIFSDLVPVGVPVVFMGLGL